MFTGLVQGIGTIHKQGQDCFKITIIRNSSQGIVADLALGDSVAVDGVCLTVEEIVSNGFLATVSPETLQRSTLGQRTMTAEYVNLETSLRVGSKIGGHFVTGHVDGVGCLSQSMATDKAWEMNFTAPPAMVDRWQNNIARYLVEKGSIAINGISLTVADCAVDGSWFKVAVIPHTYRETNLCYLQPGDLVNIESDILGKYVDRLIAHRLPSANRVEDISLAFLTENGYV
ncbi:MAG: riboflavin synthase [Xenococcaceae cyanobacterium MO_188.B32]|nr:riboflavin synthase [Xenococcaceae cyanobacterium MO_188.B32]